MLRHIQSSRGECIHISIFCKWNVHCDHNISICWWFKTQKGNSNYCCCVYFYNLGSGKQYKWVSSGSLCCFFKCLCVDGRRKTAQLGHVMLQRLFQIRLRNTFQKIHYDGEGRAFLGDVHFLGIWDRPDFGGIK